MNDCDVLSRIMIYSFSGLSKVKFHAATPLADHAATPLADHAATPLAGHARTNTFQSQHLRFPHEVSNISSHQLLTKNLLE